MAEWFTGTVRVDAMFAAPEPARVSSGTVTFEPGARTAWHSHPLGQTLIVTAGCGRVQREGGPVEVTARATSSDRAGRETLARRRPDHGDDACRHSGKP